MKKQVYMALAGLIAVLLAVIGVLLMKDIYHDYYCTCDCNRNRTKVNLNNVEYIEGIQNDDYKTYGVIDIDDYAVAIIKGQENG